MISKAEPERGKLIFRHAPSFLSLAIFTASNSSARAWLPLTNKFRTPIDAKVINCHNIRESPIPCVAPQPCENYLSSRSSSPSTGLVYLFIFLVSRANQQTLAQNDFMTFRCRLNRQCLQAKSLTKSCNSMTFLKIFFYSAGPSTRHTFLHAYMKDFHENRNSRAMLKAIG